MHYGNRVIPNAHFRKHWQRYPIKTWFDQPAKKERRSKLRKEKARKVAPRPVNRLKPVVRCPTIRYNKKIRAGKGYSLDELRSAGINPHFARTIGIAVDHRRRNKSVESLQLNVQRLKEYMSKLILIKKGGKAKAGEATDEEAKMATQYKRPIQKISQKYTRDKARAPTDEERKLEVYNYLRQARGIARSIGQKEKRAKERENEPVAAAPKEAKPKKEKKGAAAADEE